MSDLTETEIETLSLTQALARLGIEIVRDAPPHNDRRHALRRNGEELGRFDATEGWALVRKLTPDLPARNTVAALEHLLSGDALRRWMARGAPASGKSIRPF